MPDKSPGWFAAAMKRRPVLGLIAILIILVVAYLVSDNKKSPSDQGLPSTTAIVLIDVRSGSPL